MSDPRAAEDALDELGRVLEVAEGAASSAAPASSPTSDSFAPSKPQPAAGGQPSTASESADASRTGAEPYALPSVPTKNTGGRVFATPFEAEQAEREKK